MKPKYIIIALLSLAVTVSAQQWKWAHCNHGYGSGDAVAFDGSGNLFLAGSIDLFTEKFNPIGDSLWQRYTGARDAAAHNMALGPDTSIFLVGNGYIGASSFVTKCDKNGYVLWEYWNAYGGSHPANRAHAIAVDSQGNCYASGIYEDSAKFSGCTFTSSVLAGFIVKLSPQGSCLWTMDVNYAGYYANVTVDTNDDLIISTQDSIIKVSNNQVQWVVPIKELNGIWRPNVSEINTDSENNIYFVVGGDSIKVGNQSHKIRPYHGLLVKLTPSGDLAWMKEMTGPCQSIYVGQAIYLTSYYDTRIQKISLNGDSVWCRNLTSNHSYFNITNITGSNDGLIAITGLLDGIMKDGSDTIISQAYGISPFVAVMQDTAFVTHINVAKRGESDFNIYPNPSTGNLIVKMQNNVSGAKMIIRDVLGNCLFEKECRNEGDQEIDLSNAAKGIYFVEIMSENQKTVKKISLQ